VQTEKFLYEKNLSRDRKSLEKILWREKSQWRQRISAENLSRKFSEVRKSLEKISVEPEILRRESQEKILSREDSQQRNLSGVEDSQERILSREKLRRKSLTVRRTECPVCGKEAVSLRKHWQICSRA